MCNLTEHDKATSAVLPVDRCPTDRRQKTLGEVFRKAGSAPPTHTTPTHKGLVSGGLLPFSQIQGAAYNTMPGEEKHPADPWPGHYRKRVEPGREETLKIQRRWLGLCKIFTKQADWVIFSSQSSTLYRKQNLLLRFQLFISSAIPFKKNSFGYGQNSFAFGCVGSLLLRVGFSLVAVIWGDSPAAVRSASLVAEPGSRRHRQ